MDENLILHFLIDRGKKRNQLQTSIENKQTKTLMTLRASVVPLTVSTSGDQEFYSVAHEPAGKSVRQVSRWA